MIKFWWANNSWRFWAIRWVCCAEPYKALNIWCEYRYMLNPAEERTVIELILEEYSRDIDEALSNPFVAIVSTVWMWLKRKQK